MVNPHPDIHLRIAEDPTLKDDVARRQRYAFLLNAAAKTSKTGTIGVRDAKQALAAIIWHGDEVPHYSEGTPHADVMQSAGLQLDLRTSGPTFWDNIRDKAAASQEGKLIELDKIVAALADRVLAGALINSATGIDVYDSEGTTVVGVLRAVDGTRLQHDLSSPRRQVDSPSPGF